METYGWPRPGPRIREGFSEEARFKLSHEEQVGISKEVKESVLR